MATNEELKKMLIEQMRSEDNTEALRAVSELRDRGWLEDGSLRGAKMSRANLDGADLGLANLQSVDLSRANLMSANLDGANLRCAYLSNTYLNATSMKSTKLRAANLIGANLNLANLFHADLGQADLSRADLSAANLSMATLHKANLTGASCVATVFSGIDLSTVKGLDGVYHEGSSFIDIHTLYYSKGQIPDKFLRGCGIPENLITYHRSLVGNAVDFYPAFISYSHENLAFAQRIHDTLQGQGIRCWLDVHQLKPGHHIWDEIERGIRLWDKTILCCSEHSLTSDWVENELENLFAKERRVREQLKKQQGSDPGPVRLLIPLDLDGYVFSEKFKSGMKQHIVSRNVADFTNWKSDSDKFDREMEKVVAFLRPDEGREPPPPSQLPR